jgi:hypothetical protein
LQHLLHHDQRHSTTNAVAGGHTNPCTDSDTNDNAVRLRTVRGDGLRLRRL